MFAFYRVRKDLPRFRKDFLLRLADLVKANIMGGEMMRGGQPCKEVTDVIIATFCHLSTLLGTPDTVFHPPFCDAYGTK